MTDSQGAIRLARRGQIATAIGLVGLAAVYVIAVEFTPMHATQGLAQKIFYVHVPAAWGAGMAFVVTGVLSILYLWLKDQRLDASAAASAEVGVAFATVMLTTGPIWGKAAWDAWWAWDARLTFTLLLFLMFVGYLLMRGSVIDFDQRARFSAVFGVLGLVLVPFIHMTVYWFDTQHPKPVVLNPEGPTLDSTMFRTLMISLAVFTVLYVGFLTQRLALSQLRDANERKAHGIP